MLVRPGGLPRGCAGSLSRFCRWCRLASPPTCVSFIRRIGEPGWIGWPSPGRRSLAPTACGCTPALSSEPSPAASAMRRSPSPACSINRPQPDTSPANCWIRSPICWPATPVLRAPAISRSGMDGGGCRPRYVLRRRSRFQSARITYSPGRRKPPLNWLTPGRRNRGRPQDDLPRRYPFLRAGAHLFARGRGGDGLSRPRYRLAQRHAEPTPHERLAQSPLRVTM